MARCEDAKAYAPPLAAHLGGLTGPHGELLDSERSGLIAFARQADPDERGPHMPAEWTENPMAACRRFLDEQGTTTHIMAQDYGTMILTKLNRIDLVDYLNRLREAVVRGFGDEGETDLVHMEMRELPGGDRLISAILREDVL